jgi:hypothetical protein
MMMEDGVELFMPGRADPNALAGRAPVAFRPVWNVGMNSLSGFIARVAPPDEGAVPKDDDGRRAALDDMTALAKAAEVLEESLEIGRKAVIIAPVASTTLLRHPFRGAYLSLLRRTPARIRALVALQIVSIPAYAPKERLQSMQRDIAPLCRAIILTSDIFCANLDCVPQGSVHACALSFDALSEGERECRNLMTRFADKTRCIGCLAMADGVSSRPVLMAAVAAGFGYIAGPAVEADRGDIFPVRRFDAAGALNGGRNAFS